MSGLARRAAIASSALLGGAVSIGSSSVLTIKPNIRSVRDDSTGVRILEGPRDSSPVTRPWIPDPAGTDGGLSWAIGGWSAIGTVKASGPAEILKLIQNVIEKQEERTRTRKLRTR